MKSLRGIGSAILLLVVGALLLLVVWIILGRETESLLRDPARLKESMVSEKVTEDMAHHNVGIAYSFGALTMSVSDIYEQDGSYQRLCAQGKLNRNAPEVMRELNYVVCGPNPSCGDTPYPFRDEAKHQCYASKNEYAISAYIYGADGVLTPTCGDRNGTQEGVANPSTFRCDRL